ncbi:MAG TPA: MCE family protein [Prolixibacteraceae bacterium]|jgi:phospholipid/cholesterol/gamma-HCH transport system substrate-binding protein|nr:MCE family protein [Prolixibacteraceae bacterium]
MKNTPNKKAVIVGVFVLIGLIFLVLGILLIGNLNETFKRKIELSTLFDDVGGLQVGNNVWFSGVKVGSISHLQFYADSKVKVGMKIEAKSVPFIHKDARVKLGSDGFIGNKILVIYGGTSESPQVEPGDTLRVEKTFSSEDMINTLQENNKNLLAITTDFKVISNKMAHGEGLMGKLLNDESVYSHLDAATLSLQNAANKANQLIGSLNTFSEGLNKKGTLANELSTDTLVFNSLRASVRHFQQIADTAGILMNNLKEASGNPHSSVGVLLHDEDAGAHLKQTIMNLETSSQKLDEDLEAAQHNFLLRGFFKKKDRQNRKQAE